jgi:hypothetical protein
MCTFFPGKSSAQNAVLLNELNIDALRTFSLSLCLDQVPFLIFTFSPTCHHDRSCMLKPYSGLYANGIKIAKSATTELNNLSNNKERLEGAVEDRDAGWGLEIPPHICISDNSAAWVPLDRALQVSTAVLGFLSEKQMLALHRQVEHEAMFLNKHGELVEPEGSHTVIRAAVRKILKQNVEKISEDEHDTNSQDDTIIVVNMEKVLQS